MSIKVNRIAHVHVHIRNCQTMGMCIVIYTYNICKFDHYFIELHAVAADRFLCFCALCWIFRVKLFHFVHGFECYGAVSRMVVEPFVWIKQKHDKDEFSWKFVFNGWKWPFWVITTWENIIRHVFSTFILNIKGRVGAHTPKEIKNRIVAAFFCLHSTSERHQLCRIKVICDLI